MGTTMSQTSLATSVARHVFDSNTSRGDSRGHEDSCPHAGVRCYREPAGRLHVPQLAAVHGSPFVFGSGAGPFSGSH